MYSDVNENICTVLLISYNHAAYFRDAVESVLEQKTDHNFKIHIFDDASTDGTIDLIKEYESKYPGKIKAYINDKNLGAQENIWRAYQSVDTKYCILLETDDYWCDNKKLDLQIKLMEQHPECSFCGHNTRYLAMNEHCREYEEDTLICTNPILKSKKVFTYEDFYPITNGGYIPYVSTRLVRTSCIDIENIKYKEAFLFDHTQFYYLLLKGDFAYIDKPMSVYRRTGKGACSEKRPLEFLNTFIQNSLDFNKQTNYEIADKIFADCLLQTDFRLKLDVGYRSRNISLVEEDGFANLVSPVALGDTMILAGYKREIEKKYNVKLRYLIKPQYKVVMDMYEISDYKIIEHMDSIDWDAVLNKEDIPTSGKLYFGHPIFYFEYRNMYNALRNKQLDIDFLRYFKTFLNLNDDAVFEFPHTLPKLSKVGMNAIGGIDFNKTVLFLPEAASCSEIGEKFWEEKAMVYLKRGYNVLINSKENYNIKGTKTIFLSTSDTVALASLCDSVYALRSGMCDVIAKFCKALTVYYPTYADLYIFGLRNMYGDIFENLHEELVLSTNINYVGEQNIKPIPKLFGRINTPEFIYRFYLKHKKHLYKFKHLVVKE